MQRRAALRVLSCAALAGLVACGRNSQPTAGGKRKLTIGLAIASHVHAVAWIAKAKGMFAAEGIEADVQVLAGSAAAIRTLIAGQIDVALAGGDAVLKAAWAGAELAVVGGLVDRFYHRIVARRGITAAELRGKRLGLPFLGGPQDMAVSFALRKLGLSRQDVEIVVLGKDLNLIAALEKGDVDATTSELPKPRLARMQLEVIADLPAEPARFPYLVVAVKKELVVRERPLVTSVLAALCQATAYYRDPANRAASLDLVREHIRIADPALSAELHAESGPLLLARPPLPSREAFETVIELSGRGDLEKRQLDLLIDWGPVLAARADGRCAVEERP